jgi:hypothetical protein
MYTLGEVKLNPAGIHSVMFSQRGDVARYIRKLGEAVVLFAKLKAGVKTGNLKRTISMRVDRTSLTGYGVLVGSSVRHALVHHQGARPHVIRPRGRGYLKFRGRNGTVYTRLVKHPGHKSNPYLLEALRAVVR